jgi:hypothetical protein
MPDPKYAPQKQGNSPEPTVTSYIRPHETADVDLPKYDPFLGASEGSMRVGAEDFLEDWALRHFMVSVKLHDVGRVSEDDIEKQLVLEDLSVVQGILLEVHDFATSDERVKALMRTSTVLQNGVAALYGWLDDVLDAASRLRVARGKPGFVDSSEEALTAILRNLERVHPDLEVLLRTEVLGVDGDVARKLALCFRQIGAVVVRVSGRAGSSIPPGP